MAEPLYDSIANNSVTLASFLIPLAIGLPLFWHWQRSPRLAAMSFVHLFVPFLFFMASTITAVLRERAAFYLFLSACVLLVLATISLGLVTICVLRYYGFVRAMATGIPRPNQGR